MLGSKAKRRTSRTVQMNSGYPIEHILAKLRGMELRNESAVERELLEPCLESLGWRIAKGENKQVRVNFTPEMTRFWKYKRGWMKRDYVLNREPAGAIHIEAKHRWRPRQPALNRYLAKASVDDWEGSQNDGAWKDLALLLWGARSQSATRAAIVDNVRILVFDWYGGWKLTIEQELFGSTTDGVLAAFRLLAMEEPTPDR